MTRRVDLARAPLARLRGEKGGKSGGGSRTPVESPDSLFADATAMIVDVLSEGPIAGWADPANPARCIFFDGTPLENDDGSLNFEGVRYTLRTGEPDQSYVPGFSAAESEISVGIRVEQATPVARSITNADADAARVTIGVGAFSDLNSANGNLRATSVDYVIEMQVGAAAWTTAVEGTIAGKTSSEYQRAHRIELPAERPLALRVRRITADSDRSTLQNDLFFVSLTEIIDAKFAYPSTAYVALELPAEAFGGRLPVRTYQIAGVEVLVPSNYDPVARTYDESVIWDGSLTRAHTRNPAWILYAMLTETRWGLGDRINANAPDRYAFYAIGRYCDELVDDGAGGLEPRYSADGFFAERDEAFNVLLELAALFRGQVFLGAGAIVPVADMPGDPVKLVTNANVIDGRFDYAGTGLAARHTAAAASYRDPTDRYALKQLISYDDAAAVDRYGFREVEIELPFTVSPAEALRACKWAVDTDTTQRETVTYLAGLDHAGVRPGDVVLIADKHRAGWRVGGRLAAVAAQSLTLDARVAFDAAESYSIAVALADGGFAELAVAGGHSGETTAVPLAAAHGLDIRVGAPFAVILATQRPRRFRVLSNVPQGEGQMQFGITAVEDDPDKYARVESGLDLDTDPPYLLLPTGKLPPPVGFAVEEVLYAQLGQVFARLEISITPATDPRIRAYEVEVKRPDAAGFESLGAQAGLLFELPAIDPGDFTIRARSIDALFGASEWRVEVYSAAGLLAPPSDVAEITAALVGGSVALNWSGVADLDVVKYAIRYAASSTSWTAGLLVAEIAAPAATAIVPPLSGTYMVKAVDSSGRESAIAATVTIVVEAEAGFNVVELVEGGPSWSGAGAGAEVSGSAVTLSSGFDVGTYQLAEEVDLGQVYVSRVSVMLSAYGERAGDTMADWVSLASVEALSSVAASAWSAAVEVSTAEDDPPTWGAWAPLSIGDVRARHLRFRLALASLEAGVAPFATSVKITVDMPDRTDGATDLTCPAAGLRVAHAPAFAVRPAVAVEVAQLAAGERHEITNADATGFDLQCFDSAGAAAARQFDYVARGYGRLQT